MKKIEDKKYLKWIREQKCWYCGAPPPNEPHHVGDGVHTRRGNDHMVLPTCRKDHDIVDNQNWLFDLDDLRERAKAYYQRYLDEKQKAKEIKMSLL